MLLPPAGMTRRIWRQQVTALAGQFRVLTPDLPGYSGVPGPFTFDRAVAEVVRRAGGSDGQVHLCGISLSATVAVLTCLAHPELIRSLVLSGGIAHPPPLLGIQRAVLAAMPERLIASLQARQAGSAMAGMPEGERAGMSEGVAADFRMAGKRAFLDSLRELARTDLRGQLRKVTAPTLVLCGDRDTVNLPGARELAAGIPGAELRIVPDSRHLWNLQHPELFAETLAGFIHGVAGR